MLVTQYAQYLELQSLEEARAVYKRACEVHLIYKPNMHMQWAAFEERHGKRTPGLTQLFFTFTVYLQVKIKVGSV